MKKFETKYPISEYGWVSVEIKKDKPTTGDIVTDMYNIQHVVLDVAPFAKRYNGATFVRVKLL